jgi:Cd2+/Zn2+-exporting ATPase
MKKRRNKIIIALILFTISTIIKFQNEWINNIIYILSYLIVGTDIVKKAIRNILRGKVLDENFLMTIATLGAFGIGEFPEAVVVMLFYQIGELFQSYAVDKSRKSIASLMNIRPDYANLLKNNDVEKVSPEEVQIGDTIIVKPGEKVPLDGIVLEGESMIDTSALTGESVPKKATSGDKILSGGINESGLLKIQVTKEFGESTVSKILELVESASSKKSKSENFITKFAKYYTPIVVIIAVVLAIFPPLFIKGQIFLDWLYRALSFLVVSCPCALVISIPLSFFSGLGAASKIGVLIKGSNYLESLANTEIVVFDKTGTLTKGVFEVQKVEAENMPNEELIRIAAHAESYSNHPISSSIKKAYNNNEINNNIVTDVKEIAGQGIVAKVEGKEVLVGNEKLMQERKINYKKCEEVGTIIYVAINNVYVGYILISDTIKEDSKIAIEELKKNNIKQIVMLTGDRKTVGEQVAKQLSINKVYTELLPDKKVEKLEQIIKEKRPKGKLIFVGDGINDAPVLVLADIGIAMGALGSDAAIEAADIVIMTDEPFKISKIIKLSKKTMGIVKQNIILAITVKAIVLILSAIGLSTMWEAVFADVGVSIIAIINALRVLRTK